jgi:hypothetical protein
VLVAAAVGYALTGGCYLLAARRNPPQPNMSVMTRHADV